MLSLTSRRSRSSCPSRCWEGLWGVGEWRALYY
jgi:hypothetical protein